VNILICDDHVVFADSLAHLIRARSSDSVAVTYHPDDAMRALGETKTDILILDVMFDDESVLDRLTSLREISPCTRLLVLTGRLDDMTIAAGRAAGVVGFAEKVQSAKDIMTTIAKISVGTVVIPDGFERATHASAMGHPPGQAARRLASFLTPRERQVLSALVGGSDTATLASELNISRATARSHIQSMLTKMNVHSRLEAATSAVRNGLVNPETGEWLL
jgi:DNA-binding NarL/FixJ family response regulator